MVRLSYAVQTHAAATVRPRFLGQHGLASDTLQLLSSAARYDQGKTALLYMTQRSPRDSILRIYNYGYHTIMVRAVTTRNSTNAFIQLSRMQSYRQRREADTPFKKCARSLQTEHRAHPGHQGDQPCALGLLEKSVSSTRTTWVTNSARVVSHCGQTVS